jgi:uncharacterized protein (TIGR02145 family)
MKTNRIYFAVALTAIGCASVQQNHSSPEVIEVEINQALEESEILTSDTVLIGTQTWQTTNLDVITFRNGDTILYAASDEEWVNAGKNKVPAWCYLNNDSENGTKYGKLYNWHAVTDVRGLAPQGWRIPSNDDFKVLEDFVGISKGEVLKSTEGWENGGNGTNSSNFSALAGSFRNATGLFNPAGRLAAWWTITEDNSGSAWGFSLTAADNILVRKGYYKRSGLSVRCLR